MDIQTVMALQVLMANVLLLDAALAVVFVYLYRVQKPGETPVTKKRFSHYSAITAICAKCEREVARFATSKSGKLFCANCLREVNDRVL